MPSGARSKTWRARVAALPALAPTLTVALTLAGLLVAVETPSAHHPIPAKFDDTQPVTLTGVVTLVDWRNPHVHVFVNVRGGGNGGNGGNAGNVGNVVNWAVELESPIELRRHGWAHDDVQPGDEVSVQGIAARDGSRQVWARSMVLSGTGRAVFHIVPEAPRAPLASRPTPRWPDGQPRLGPLPGGVQGYWADPSSTVLAQQGIDVQMDRWGLLGNIADASRVAPLQPWARALYEVRQRRFLQDDPTYLNCKPEGGPRKFQSPYGVQFVEDRERQRIFVLIGGSNSNFQIIYLDGRSQVGQVGGDDDNPLYFGRSVAQWEGDTLVVDTRGFNEDFWFTNGGLPHTNQLHLIERFTRSNFDTLRYDVTIDDPGAYTRSWSSGWNLRWIAGEDLPRHLCQDNRP